MRMTETLRKCTLVSNIMTGKHEGLHVHFEDFADLIKDECLDAELWQEKNAELMALETTFEIYIPMPLPRSRCSYQKLSALSDA